MDVALVADELCVPYRLGTLICIGARVRRVGKRGVMQEDLTGCLQQELSEAVTKMLI